jgi:hypothetical protein
MFQSRDSIKDKYEEHLRNYLQIDEQHVLIDEEVDKYFLETWRHNGHFYWVDFETDKIFYC